MGLKSSLKEGLSFWDQRFKESLSVQIANSIKSFNPSDGQRFACRQQKCAKKSLSDDLYL